MGDREVRVDLRPFTFLNQTSAATAQIGFFESNPTFLESDLECSDLVFGLYDLEWDVAMPYVEAAHKVLIGLKP